MWPFQLAALLAIVAALRRFEGRPRRLAAILGGAIVLQAVWYVPTTLVGLVLLLTRTRRAWNATAAVPRVGT